MLNSKFLPQACKVHNMLELVSILERFSHKAIGRKKLPHIRGNGSLRQHDRRHRILTIAIRTLRGIRLAQRAIILARLQRHGTQPGIIK